MRSTAKHGAAQWGARGACGWVEGQWDAGTRAAGAAAGLFPAPKVEADQLVNELQPTRNPQMRGQGCGWRQPQQKPTGLGQLAGNALRPSTFAHSPLTLTERGRTDSSATSPTTTLACTRERATAHQQSRGTRTCSQWVMWKQAGL